MTNKLKAVIFDMDGVLIDSGPLVSSSFTKILSDYGVVISEEDRRKNKGRSLKDLIEIWNKQHDKNINFEDFKRKALEIQFSLLSEVEFDKLLLKFIKELEKDKILMGVGTSSSVDRAEHFLSHLGIKSYFPTLITADDIDNHKPHPEVFLEVAKKLGVEPKECIVLEDATLGIQAAKNAGMKVVCCKVYHDMVDSSQADLVINNYESLTLNKLKELF